LAIVEVAVGADHEAASEPLNDLAICRFNAADFEAVVLDYRCLLLNVERVH
jgi:hypothetical protein